MFILLNDEETSKQVNQKRTKNSCNTIEAILKLKDISQFLEVVQVKLLVVLKRKQQIPNFEQVIHKRLS